MANQNALTTPTLITNGEDVSAAVTNRIVSNTGGLIDTVTILSGNLEATSGNSTVNVVANRDVMIFCNNTSNIVVNLPPASSQLVTKKIRVRKTQNNYFTVTVTRNGSDVIDNPFAPTGVPVNTTFILYLPGEEYEFYSDGNVWRVGIVNESTQMYRSRAFRPLVQNLTGGGFQKLQRTSEVNDIGNFYDNVTNFRFTPQIPGIYRIFGNVEFMAGVTADSVITIYRNNVEFQRGTGRVNGNGSVESGVFTTVEVTNIGDQFEFWAYNSPNAKNVNSGVQYNSNMELMKRL